MGNGNLMHEVAESNSRPDEPCADVRLVSLACLLSGNPGHFVLEYFQTKELGSFRVDFLAILSRLGKRA